MPEGTVDVIPVDLVVGAIIGVAARGPANEDGSPDITQVASGSANPLKYERLVELVQDWFSEHPLYDAEGQPISRAATGATPAAAGSQGQLERASRPARRAPRRSSAPSPSGASRPSGRPRSRRSGRWPSGPSPTSSSTAPTPRARRSTASTTCSPCTSRSTPTTRRDFGMDPRVVDWDHYVHQIHLPSVVEHARVRTDGSEGRRRVPVHPPAPPGPLPRPPAGRVRPREHADRVERGHLLRLAGQPPPRPRRQAPPRRQAHRRGAPAC